MIALGQGSKRDLSKRHLLFAVITASAGLFITFKASSAGDNPACNPKAGTCYEINKTPGCAIAVCCNIVCDVDPFCCEAEWDLICVDFAVDICATCPGKGSCFEDGDTPSCNDTACCEIVCTIDAFCCHTAWDLICVGEAELLCLNDPCELKCPDGAIAEVDLCEEDTNGGCNQDPPQFTTINCGETYCGTSSADGNRDTDWYEITVNETSNLIWSVTSEFPSALFGIIGDCEFGFQVVASANGYGCSAASLQMCVEPGTYYFVVTTGTEFRAILDGIPCPEKGGEIPVFGNTYIATLDCQGCASKCPADLDDDGTVSTVDLLILFSAWGPNPGHPADLDSSGEVGTADLLILFANWGACP